MRALLVIAGVILAFTGCADDSNSSITTIEAPSESTTTPASSTAAVTAAELFTVEGHHRRSAAVGWSPDGTDLITAIDGFIAVWDASTGEPLAEQPIDHVEGVSAIVRSSEVTLVEGSTDEESGFFDAATGELHVAGPLLDDFLAFGPDGTRIAVGGAYGWVGVVDATTGDLQLEFPLGPGWSWAAAWSPDGSRIATTWGTRVQVWDARSGDLLLTLTRWNEVTDVAWSPDGSLVATASRDARVAAVSDAESGDHVAHLSGHTGGIAAVAWSPDSTRIATAGIDGTARIWDATSGDELAALTGHVAEVSDAAWSPDGRLIATASLDGTTKVWQVD